MSIDPQPSGSKAAMPGVSGGSTDAGGRPASAPGTSVWLDADQQRLWRSYLDGTTLLEEAIGREHERSLPLSLGEYELMVRLSEAPGHTVRMSALAAGLGRSRSRLSHTVARMQDRGLVERRAAAGDRRGVECVLTPEGLRTLQKAAPGHVAAVRRYLVDVLTPEQLRALGEAMAIVAAQCRAAGVGGSGPVCR